MPIADLVRSPAAALALSMVCLLTGCAANSPPSVVELVAPAQWYATLPAASASVPPDTTATSLPHNGSLTSLSQWWRQQNDPLLVELIEAAQVVSPSVVSARSNIEQARASQVSSEAALLPTLDGTGSLSRSLAAPINRTAVPPIANFAQLGLQTSWEADLFGQNQASLDADRERFRGSQALWHDARILVAAEVANQYYSLRACEKLLLVARADARSRSETSRLTELATRAGFGAPATAALARASAAESRSRVTQQGAQCQLDVKALVSMTAVAEPELLQKLARAPSEQPLQAIAEISSVPAEALSQRPDVYNSARGVSAASFDVGSARAQRFPRLTISGSIARNKSSARRFTQSFDTWSIGPVALTVPLFDGGAAEANLEAAKARYEEAVGKYHGTVRQAVREVEEALVNLQATADRAADTAIAEDGYRASFTGTQARYKAGLASLVELEDSRRTLLTAQSAVITLERERRSAWIALYRALGGGWTAAALPAPPMVYDIPASALPFWN